MEVAVRYQSQGGNTKQIAEAIADALGVSARPISSGLEGHVDVLFVGGGVYGGALRPELSKFLQGLDATAAGRIVTFSTSHRATKINELVAADVDGIPVDGQAFACVGKFLFFNRKRPDENDIQAAAAFARQVVEA